MVQFQKPKKMYNDRRFYFGGGPGIVPNDSFGSAALANAGADRRDSRSRGSYMPSGPPNGTHKPGLHPAAYPMPCVPIPPYNGGPQPYAIPTRGAIHGPVGGIPHVPQPGSRGFSAGRVNAGHLPHQQQQPIGAGMGSSFNFPSMETPNSQPSPGGPLSQPGFVSNMTQGASQTYRDGFSVVGMSQDYMGHGSQGLFTQVGFKDPSQDESSQSHFSGAAATSLHTQGVMNPLYSQPFTHYNSQPLNVPPQQQQQAPRQTSHYNG